ncbi:unnamed protein product [Moneuplotes crassus]|uniref:DUF4200 domain-containing protein n=1 Tax=Euplotes crassus TaxID=5936 RepID=A0AAD1UIX1_EUPCR|nr:unnamed protein product [Moneuplotes crassus]
MILNNDEFITPATKLLEKRKELYETQEALEKEKDNFKQKEFKKEENDLREKDLKIQESLIRFSKYLEENKAEQETSKLGLRGAEWEEFDKSSKKTIYYLRAEVAKAKAEFEEKEAKANKMKIYEELVTYINERETKNKLQSVIDELNNEIESLSQVKVFGKTFSVNDLITKKIALNNKIAQKRKLVEELEK